MSEMISDEEFQEIANNASLKDHNEEIKLTKEQYIMMQYSGPLPPSKELSGYEQVVPGSADRIIFMSEKEQEHRHKMDDQCFRTDSRDSLLGILFAFVLGLSSIIGGVGACIFAPNITGNIIGGIIGVGGIGTVIVTLIKSTQTTWKNKND